MRLGSQLTGEETDTIVIVRSMSPDQFFSSEQRRRLEGLVTLWRDAVARNRSLSSEEQAELEQLVEAEVRATTARAAELIHELGQ